MPYKIAYTINNLNTAGMKFVIADLVQSLDRDRFEPLIIVNQKTGSSLEKEMESVCPVKEIPFRKFSLKNIFSKASDLVHSFDYISSPYEGVAARQAGIPWIVEKTNLSWNPRRWWLKCFLAKKIVCLSKAQMQVMKSWSKKLVHIPTGVDLEHFEKTKAFLRKDFSLNSEDIVLACLAHLVPVKGHEELLEAFAEVSSQIPSLKLLLAGCGESFYEKKLREKTKFLGLEKKVRFLGNVEDAAAFLKICDGKILATRNEGRRESYGAAIIEAMAAGLPVIATRSGGPEELVVEEETGWLVDAQGHKPLVHALKDFCRDQEKRKRFGKKGHQRAREHFGKDLMTKRYQDLYFSILSEKGACA